MASTVPFINRGTGQVIEHQRQHQVEEVAAGGPWADTRLDERAALVERVAVALENSASSGLADTFSREHGRTEVEAIAELDRAVATLRWAAAAGEAIALAKDTDLALSAYVFGAVALAERIDAGNVRVNAVGGAAPDAPLGGRRRSGYGYEGGAEGLLTFCRLKVVHRRETGS